MDRVQYYLNGEFEGTQYQEAYGYKLQAPTLLLGDPPPGRVPFCSVSVFCPCLFFLLPLNYSQDGRTTGRKHMGFTIYVRMKRAGKQKREDLVPVSFELEQRPDTVRELLVSLARLSARQYNERRDEGQILGYLTGEEIAGRASAGKVSFGLHGGGAAKPDEAVENVIQCFEDGIFRVFAGEEEFTELGQRIPWRDCSGSGDLVFTFIRLTMLSGW